MKKDKDRKATISTRGGMEEKIVEQYPALMKLVNEYLIPGMWIKIKEEYRQYFEMKDKVKKLIEEFELEYKGVDRRVKDLEWEVKQLKEGIGKMLIDSCKR